MSLLFNFVELAALALTFIFFCFSADIFFQHSTHFRLYYIIESEEVQSFFKKNDKKIFFAKNANNS